nr:MAG TPA: hypothetical protein [Bacteriophage sp.]
MHRQLLDFAATVIYPRFIEIWSGSFSVCSEASYYTCALKARESFHII